MDILPCEKCNDGKLVPLSDYGPKGAAEPFKAWVCTDPKCGFSIRIDQGRLSYGPKIQSRD